MSDENAPKLRLKPKLGADAAVTPQAPAAPSESAAPVPEPPAEGVKLVRLRPKLAPAPAQETATTAASTPEPVTDVPVVAPAPMEAARPKPRLSTPPMEVARPTTTPPFSMQPPAPVAEPAAPVEAAKPAFRLGLKAKSAAAAPGPAFPPPVEGQAVLPPDMAAPMLDAPPPTLAIDNGENGEPAEITAMRKASSVPFPPPGRFPPPPGLKMAMAEAGEEASGAPRAKVKGKKSKSKKPVLLAVVGLLLVVGLGGFFAYQKMTAEPPPPPRKPRPAAAPVPEPPVEAAATPATTPSATETAAKPTETKPAEVAATETKPVETAAVVPEAKPVETKPVEPPPPPPPTVAFRSWVENLQIRGMRAGATPRVFIGNSSYAKGDLVNPTLGISFEGVNETTKYLIFKDTKTGARIERRQ